MKLDIAVLAAHPDDAELGCGGTIAKHTAAGQKVGVFDLTAGELGSRGSVEERRAEAKKSSKILGLSVRENLGFRDGFFENDEKHRLGIIRLLRKYRPEIVLINAPSDRHPDHGRAALLGQDACFLSGLRKIETEYKGKKQKEWRPKNVFNYIQSNYLEPDFVVDVSDFWEIKMKAVRAFKTQFYDPKSSDGPQTFISSPEFTLFLEARAREYGQASRIKFGEGFIKSRQIAVDNLFDLK